LDNEAEASDVLLLLLLERLTQIQAMRGMIRMIVTSGTHHGLVEDKLQIRGYLSK
jgi:hypothetical protein